MTHIDFLDEQVGDCNGKIEQLISEPSDEQAELASSASDDQLQEQAPVSCTPIGVESTLAQDPVSEDGPKAPLSCRQAVALLDSIPGINQRIAEILIAEVGTNMQRFPTAQHLASWVGICPGNHQSTTSAEWFRAHVWRSEFYRLQSTFPQHEHSGQPAHAPSDETILVDWSTSLAHNYQEFQASHPQAALQQVLDAVRRFLDRLGG